jgi:hypothetical protein
VRSPPPLTEHHLCWRSVVGGCVPNGGHRTIHSNFLWGRTAASHAASREAPRGTVCRRALKISIWNGPPRLDCSAVRKAWDRQSLPTLRGRLVAARHARGLYKHHSGHAPPCTMIVLDAMWCKVSERKLARSWARGLESVCATEALKAFFLFLYRETPLRGNARQPHQAAGGPRGFQKPTLNGGVQRQESSRRKKTLR